MTSALQRPSEAFLQRLGLRYAVIGRAGVGVAVAVIAPFENGPIGRGALLIVAAGLIVWSVLYVRLMWNESQTWCWCLDVAVMSVLCLTQPWLVTPDVAAGQQGWMVPVTSFTVVALQCHVRLMPAAAATAVVATANILGLSLVPTSSLGQVLAANATWMVVEAALARVLWILVQRGGRVADQVMAARFTQEREVTLAAARRKDQRVHWAAVHDTAASTLLMIGLGEVEGSEPWLKDQLERDIAALTGDEVPRNESQHLAALLREVTGRSRLDVELAFEPAEVADVWLNPVLAGAVEGAVGEALENVRRHAGVRHAVVHAGRRPAGLALTITDAGCGFDHAAVPHGRHGLVLSVRERMAHAGGHAVIESTPGSGTRVTLEFHDG